MEAETVPVRDVNKCLYCEDHVAVIIRYDHSDMWYDSYHKRITCSICVLGFGPGGIPEAIRAALGSGMKLPYAQSYIPSAARQ
jgi:hypothetical protein